MNPAPHTQLVIKAASLSTDYPALLDTYDKWNKREIKFIFSTNPNLADKIAKPSCFHNDKLKFMDYWKNKLIWEKRAILCYFSSKSELSIGEYSYKDIKDAFDKWPSNHYGLFHGLDYSWTWNLFVGVALFLMGRNITNASGNYYSATQIYNGEGPFEIIEKRDANKKVLVSIGDIACMMERKICWNRNTSKYTFILWWWFLFQRRRKRLWRWRQGKVWSNNSI